MPAGQPDASPDELAADLATRYFERLQVFAARRLRDAASGEEVAQEALRRTLEALRDGRIANLAALPAFLFETARNVCMHRQRAGGREARALERFVRHPGQEHVHPLDVLISSQEATAVREALDRLSAEDRDVLLWSYRDGLDALEIGKRLGLSPGAVRVRRHRALERLSDALGVTRWSDREQL